VPECSPGRAGDGGGEGRGRLGFGGAAAAGAGGRKPETRRGDAGADAGERGGLHRGHRRARPPLRVPGSRVARGLRRRRRRRLRHALLHAPTRQHPFPSLPPLLTLLSAQEYSTVQCRVLFPVNSAIVCSSFVFLQIRIVRKNKIWLRSRQHCCCYSVQIPDAEKRKKNKIGSVFSLELSMLQ
jgi:hypothetical protein